MVQGTGLENTRSKSRPFLCRIDQSVFPRSSAARDASAWCPKPAASEELGPKLEPTVSRKNDAQAGASLSQEKVQQGVSYAWTEWRYLPSR